MNEFGDGAWSDVRDELGGAARDWWDDNRAELTTLGRREIEDMIRGLRRGKRSAQVEIVARMTPDQWARYRDGVTRGLNDIGRRRAQLLRSLEGLGWILSRVLGRRAARALGL